MKINYKDLNYKDVGKFVDNVDLRSKELLAFVNKIVDEHSRDIDKLVSDIRRALYSGQDLTNEELSAIILKIPAVLYFCNNGRELVGLKEDIAGAVKKIKFSEFYAKTAGTVADKTADAETKVQTEAVAEIIFNSAYKIIKAKLDTAYELLLSAKKVLGARIFEAELPENTTEEGKNDNAR